MSVKGAKPQAAVDGSSNHIRYFLALLGLGLLLTAGCGKPAVVLYCAQDREFAEDILHGFEQRSGWPVTTRFDNEANKAVGLYDDLVREARQPRCSVYWNNEIIGTFRLAKQGLLEPHDSPAAGAFPAQWRAKDHTWHAFAARARVLLLNTDKLRQRGIPEDQWPRSLDDLTYPRWRGEVAMSKPAAGTSATQAACLFAAWGDDRAKAWYRGLRQNDVKLVAGNKLVAVGVGQGQFLVGLTDTDDAMAEVNAGKQVRMVFPDADAPEGSNRGTLFIPNTVVIIKGGPNQDGARQLVDYLLSAEVETKLATREGGYHIPLNPAVKADLPESMRPARSARQLAVDFGRAAERWDEAQKFLREEFGY
jgi:iron(III) transport system substrate-binding protein